MDVLLWVVETLDRVDDALGGVLEVAVAGPVAAKAIGPRLSAGLGEHEGRAYGVRVRRGKAQGEV